MLYYSFVYSRVTYGITIWSTENQTRLREVEINMNNIVRTTTWNKKFTHVTQPYQKLNRLKLNDVYKLELAKLMHKLHNNKLLFKINFRKLKIFIHIKLGDQIKQTTFYQEQAKLQLVKTN